MDSILGIKKGQEQRFLENGKRIPVTKVKVEDNRVTALKMSDKNGYSAVQIGIGKKKHPSKALLGHVKKANLDQVPQTLREIRVDSDPSVDLLGTSIALETVFQPGDIVQVTGISKGKGFAGVVKRHHFRGGPRTHGQSDRERHPGSIGQTTTPGRVYKGKRMAGRMGQDKVTIKNVTVVEVDAIEKMLLIDGLLPGSVNTVLYVTKIGTEKNYMPLQSDKVEEPVVEEAPAEEVSVEAPVEEAPVVEEVVEESTAPATDIVEETEVSTEEVAPEEVTETPDTSAGQVSSDGDSVQESEEKDGNK